MKKIKPLSGYEEHDGYPAVTREGSNRRGFLKAALAGTAAVGGSLLLGSEAASRKKSPFLRVTFILRGHYQYYPCRYRAQSLLVQTKDKRFAAFVQTPKQRGTIERALAPILKAAKCTDVQNPKKLARLHKKLGRALVKIYRKQTRRTASRPIVTLSLRRIRMPVPGGLRPPIRPRP